MEKNVTDKLIEIRKSKGFKTRDMLMRSIEKFCKENNEKSFTDHLGVWENIKKIFHITFFLLEKLLYASWFFVSIYWFMQVLRDKI